MQEDISGGTQMDKDLFKAFEGRWRIKFNQILLSRASAGTFDELADYVKSLCLDFFQAAWLLNQTEEVEVIDTDFETWWSMYDKKCGKSDCMKKWAKLSSKEKVACIAATPYYVASTKEKRFRKNPLTYLNQKAWNDEIIPRNGTEQPTVEQQRTDKLTDILVG